MSRIVYHRKYNIGFYGLERLHPFDSRKYGRAWKELRKHFGSKLADLNLAPTGPASTEDLRLVHSEGYLRKLRDSKYVAGALELPIVAKLPAWVIDHHVLKPMRWGTAGTILAAQEALMHGLSINLSGGYHHAKPNRGEGFCIYSDIGVAVAVLRRDGLIGEKDRIAYIDTDAHQGNGVCHVFQGDSRTFIFDMYNSGIYPMMDVEANDRIDCNVPVSSDWSDQFYLDALRGTLPGFLDSVSKSPVGVAIYNAGTDIFAGDPLGGLNFSANTILQRDTFVVSELRKRGIPTVMVLSGGYTKQSYQLVANSVIELTESGSISS